MKNASLLLSVAGLCLLNTGSAFVPKASVGMGRVSASISNKEASTTTAIAAMDAAMISEMETARAAFVLCLAGALGTAAVGREGEFEPSDWRNMRQDFCFRRNFSPSLAFISVELFIQSFPSRSGNGRK